MTLNPDTRARAKAGRADAPTPATLAQASSRVETAAAILTTAGRMQQEVNTIVRERAGRDLPEGTAASSSTDLWANYNANLLWPPPADARQPGPPRRAMAVPRKAAPTVPPKASPVTPPKAASPTPQAATPEVVPAKAMPQRVPEKAMPRARETDIKAGLTIREGGRAEFYAPDEVARTAAAKARVAAICCASAVRSSVSAATSWRAGQR